MVRNRYFTLVGLGFLFLASLVVLRGPTEHIDHGEVAVTEVSGEVLTDTIGLDIPTAITLVGEYVVAIDIGSDSSLHVIDRSNGRLVRSFGRRGGGPGELEGAWSLDPIPNDSQSFWVYDLALKRASLVNIDAPVERNPISVSRYVQFVDQPTLTGPIRDMTGRWFSLGFFADGRLGVFDDEGNRLSVWGQVPPGPEYAPAVSRQQAWQSTLVARPDRALFASLPRYGSRIELLDAQDGVVVEVQGPVTVQNEIRAGPTLAGPSMTRDTRFGYIAASANQDGFFALFSGRTLGEFPRRANFARYVHVFDWRGDIVRVFHLEHDALSIAVDDGGETMFVLVHDPYPAIVRYTIQGDNGGPLLARNE